MTCSDPWTRDHLPDLTRGRMSVEETGRAMAHLEECPQCAEERALIEVLEGIGIPDPGVDFWSALPEKITKGIRGGEGTGLRWFGGLALAGVAATLLLFLLVPGSPHVDRLGPLIEMGPISLVDLGLEQDLLSSENENTLAVEDVLEIEIGLTEEEAALISPFTAGEFGNISMDPDTIGELERALDEMSNRG
ncbi:MAG TPA: zf-HC2 domain-containing protein [Proteobacteria bacterium]|nr:hypothetical protein BMS3Abin14_01967 [bacterium BMS3Abin14]HDL53804.1 zf-HC2 domain-containing protein [Pseudomonadota bacterium]